jgi:GDPmannose 4,6-dehydratase
LLQKRCRLATPDQISRDFLEAVFRHLDLDWKAHVEIDPRYFRPTEVDALQGDPSRARAVLGCRRRTSFPDVVKMMVESDFDLAREEKTLRDAGHAPRGRNAE